MLRLVEIALFLLPFAVFVGWRLLLPGGPSRRVLVGFACGLAALAVLLGWLSRENALSPGTLYVPPHVENGVIVQGHGAPR